MYTGEATLRRAGGLKSPPNAGVWPVINDAVVEVAAGAAGGSVYRFDRLPLSARLHGLSNMGWDALGSTTVSIGLREVGPSGVQDDDAFQAALDVSTAATTALSLLPIENWGLTVGEVLGVDGNGFADVVMVLAGTAATGGTVTIEVVYSVD